MEAARQKRLLELARESIRAHLAGEPLPPVPMELDGPENFGGAFVTLKNSGRLRGCIGRFHPRARLGSTVQEMAVAALHDERFCDQPVTLGELDALTIEISVLSTMARTDDPLSLRPGVHGIYVRNGPRSGCFLPQVATEQGWNAEQFLSYCCAGKAGLRSEAWKDPQTEVYLFTAEVFREKSRLE